ncbi:uncharacterized protein BDR25DRAFT_128669 [Lindgomyces ingoldianus]|uniref:Uncharacterized protein n=1 Tax=Lindgomyces ingoldianus TaxID=673940 RepID=A0ACB6R1F3_9PLEO|nr:uncharacterized protein BDR25DRAFT_128669 [Lindgomyces ingoldianus]KAF2473103.1 hypothetical protein BDR25DRAFT_128669 [Lindgomyces ingoldianus]
MAGHEFVELASNPADRLLFEYEMADVTAIPSDLVLDDNQEMSVFGDIMEDDDDFPEPEGYEQLRRGDSEMGDDCIGFVSEVRSPCGPPKPKILYQRTTNYAQKAALRARFNEDNAFLLDEGAEELNFAPTKGPLTFGRPHKREPGDCLPAYAKKISVNLDSDDELMINMKEKGYTDHQIAEKLAKEGRILYDKKSIGGRICRIKSAQAEHVDFLLKEGYKEWGLEDDKILLAAFELADIDINNEMEQVRSRRFHKVSTFMRKLNKDAIFSSKACKDRYQALMAGTATIPIDEDGPDNQIVRRMEMEAFRESRERIREEDCKAKERKIEEKRRARDAERSRVIQRQQEVVRAREEKAREKAERAAQKIADNQARIQRMQDEKEAKVKQREQIKERKAAEEAAAKELREKLNPHTPVKATNVAILKTITKDHPDPRSILSLADLKTLCANRNLSTEGEQKDDFVKRLDEADNANSLVALKKLVRARGLNTAGSKPQMKYQLALAEASAMSSFDKDALEKGKSKRVGQEPIDFQDGADDTEEDNEESIESCSVSLKYSELR